MKICSFVKKYVPTAALVALGVFLLSLLIYIAAILSTPFADFVNRTVGTAVRFLLSTLTAWIPFSLFELLVILALPLLVLAVILLIRRATDRLRMIRTVISVVAVIALILSSFVYTLGVGYRTAPLSEKLGIDDSREITADELYSVAYILRDEVNALAADISPEGTATKMPYTLTAASGLLSDSYADFASEHPFLVSFRSRVKPVLFSTVMSDAGITGIYSFFTGESNVNVEYPHYDILYTAAHEMAHQRGVARENEANFVAFLVCIGSDDEYVRYSGYLSVLEYVFSAAYRADPERYTDLWQSLHPAARADIRASRAVTEAHADKKFGEISDKANDNYLKFNGTEGVVTYGYVVRLTVAYYLNE